MTSHGCPYSFTSDEGSENFCNTSSAEKEEIQEQVIGARDNFAGKQKRTRTKNIKSKRKFIKLKTIL